MTDHPYIIVKKFSGEVAIYELDRIEGGIPIYDSPLTTEVRTETFAIRAAQRLTAGAAQEQETG